MRCRDVEYIVNSMNEVMKNGYQSEADLFVARAQLSLIARCDSVELAKKIRTFYPEMKSPLLNLVDMIMELILIKDFGMFKEVIGKYDK
jgi:hypothetical protein